MAWQAPQRQSDEGPASRLPRAHTGERLRHSNLLLCAVWDDRQSGRPPRRRGAAARPHHQCAVVRGAPRPAVGHEARAVVSAPVHRPPRIDHGVALFCH